LESRISKNTGIAKNIGLELHTSCNPARIENAEKFIKEHLNTT
jgi:hypothetical protein